MRKEHGVIRRLLVAFTATFCLTVGIIAGSATSASADTSHCSSTSFSVCINAGRTAHGYENHYLDNVSGPGVGYWKAYNGHNCTNYVGYMLTQNGDAGPGVPMGNATNWDNTILSNPSWGYTVNSTPAVGSIAQWDGTYGHVAYVESVGTNSITISEDDAFSGKFSWRTITTSGDWPDNFLHIKDITIGVDSPGIFRASSGNGLWHLRNQLSSGVADASFEYAAATDIPVVGDWNGDGVSTPGVIRAQGSDWRWLLRNYNSSGGADIDFTYGTITDTPVVGDWDGDGDDNPGIARSGASGLAWHLRTTTGGGSAQISFDYGNATDTPIAGDWDGDGDDNPGVVRSGSSGLSWHLRTSTNSGSAQISFEYGNSTDTPAVGDWDGDGDDNPGIVRVSASSLWWHLRTTTGNGPAQISFEYGTSTDTPIAGDWDGS